MFLIEWLVEVTKYPILPGSGLHNVIGICRHEDCWNHVARSDEAPMQLVSVHPRHVDVGDQADGFTDARRCEEIRCRREDLDGIAERPHEPSHGFEKVPIIVDDRNQRVFGQYILRRLVSLATIRASRNNRRACM